MPEGPSEKGVPELLLVFVPISPIFRQARVRHTNIKTLLGKQKMPLVRNSQNQGKGDVKCGVYVYA